MSKRHVVLPASLDDENEDNVTYGDPLVLFDGSEANRDAAYRSLIDRKVDTPEDYYRASKNKFPVVIHPVILTAFQKQLIAERKAEQYRQSQQELADKIANDLAEDDFPLWILREGKIVIIILTLVIIMITIITIIIICVATSTEVDTKMSSVITNIERERLEDLG